MPERRDDRQLHLSLRTHDAQSSKSDVKKAGQVTDLNSVRTSRHGSNVLKRVIREGFTKKK
jgi:hypothetical protein